MKTVPAASFVPRRSRPAPQRQPLAAASARALAVHGVWRRVHGRFALPESACAHDGGWDVYDADLAGCRLCGAQHACADGVCAAVMNEQGHMVCPVTALCVRTLAFSDREYVDTASHDAAPRGGGAGKVASLDASGRGGGLVLVHVRHVLCSPEWETSITSELDRVAGRVHNSALRHLRAFKAARPGVLPVVPEVVAASAAEAGVGR